MSKPTIRELLDRRQGYEPYNTELAELKVLDEALRPAAAHLDG